MRQSNDQLRTNNRMISVSEEVKRKAVEDEQLGIAGSNEDMRGRPFGRQFCTDFFRAPHAYFVNGLSLQQYIASLDMNALAALIKQAYLDALGEPCTDREIEQIFQDIHWDEKNVDERRGLVVGLLNDGGKVKVLVDKNFERQDWQIKYDSIRGKIVLAWMQAVYPEDPMHNRAVENLLQFHSQVTMGIGTIVQHMLFPEVASILSNAEDSLIITTNNKGRAVELTVSDGQWHYIVHDQVCVRSSFDDGKTGYFKISDSQLDLIITDSGFELYDLSFDNPGWVSALDQNTAVAFWTYLKRLCEEDEKVTSILQEAEHGLYSSLNYIADWLESGGYDHDLLLAEGLSRFIRLDPEFEMTDDDLHTAFSLLIKFAALENMKLHPALNGLADLLAEGYTYPVIYQQFLVILEQQTSGPIDKRLRGAEVLAFLSSKNPLNAREGFRLLVENFSGAVSRVNADIQKAFYATWKAMLPDSFKNASLSHSDSKFATREAFVCTGAGENNRFCVYATKETMQARLNDIPSLAADQSSSGSSVSSFFKMRAGSVNSLDRIRNSDELPDKNALRTAIYYELKAQITAIIPFVSFDEQASLIIKIATMQRDLLPENTFDSDFYLPEELADEENRPQELIALYEKVSEKTKLFIALDQDYPESTPEKTVALLCMCLLKSPGTEKIMSSPRWPSPNPGLSPSDSDDDRSFSIN